MVFGDLIIYQMIQYLFDYGTIIINWSELNYFT